ncbi:hypothetical protein AB0J35_60355 [Nonomuraea angiospora]|uniref:hypothetical protein n=1 Tax=Nonomuraea angiospora TaxID=46172 RepID=UPI00341E0A2B
MNEQGAPTPQRRSRGTEADPAAVNTYTDLAHALDSLRQARRLTYNDFDRATPRVARSTVSNLLSDARCTEETLLAFLEVCGVPRDQRRAWLSARERAMRGSAALVPSGAVRIRRANPRYLGVHAAIEVPGASGDLPEYVLRDFDEGPYGIRARLAAYTRSGGFLLLVGDSASGKKRSALEAALAVLPDWWLVQPPDPATLRSLAAAPPAHVVIWLDNLHRYFDGNRGLTAAMARTLLGGPNPLIMVATLWPKYFNAFMAPHPREYHRYQYEREVLLLADVCSVDTEFTPVERIRAQRAATRDPRIRVALNAERYGLTQTISAAPQLIQRYHNADKQTRAVVHATVDLERLGVLGQISGDLLGAAIPGYLRPHNPRWDRRLDDIIEQDSRFGPAAFLVPVAEGHRLSDYLLQYLLPNRHATIVPATTWQALLEHLKDPHDQARVAERAMDRLLVCYAIPLLRSAALAGNTDAGRRLADILNAQGDTEGLLQLLRDLARAGDVVALDQLLTVLSERGDDEAKLDLLRELSYGEARGHLIRLLTELGRVGELEDLAREGDAEALDQMLAMLGERGDHEAALRVLSGLSFGHARAHLTRLLVRTGRVADLEALARDGDVGAFEGWLEVLREQGGDEAAVAALHNLATSGDCRAQRRLLELRRQQEQEHTELEELIGQATRGDERAIERLKQAGRAKELAEVLSPLAATGDTNVAWHLAGALAQLERVDELASVLSGLAEAGQPSAAWQLVRVLEGAARAGEAEIVLRNLVEAGDREALERLLLQLRASGRNQAAVALLRDRAERGDAYAAERLADFFETEDELRALADEGNRFAVTRMAEHIAADGRVDEALSLLHSLIESGDTDARQTMLRLLEAHGRLTELQVLAEAGDDAARLRLLGLLEKRGRLTELQALANSGDQDAAWRLLRLLENRNGSNEAIPVLRLLFKAGDHRAGKQLAGLLESRGLMDEAINVLNVLASAGAFDAHERMITLLASQGRHDTLAELAKHGDIQAADRLTELQDPQAWEDGLRSAAYRGDAQAARRLVARLEELASADALRELIDIGIPGAVDAWTRVLHAQGRQSEAERALRFGFDPA